MNKRIPLIERLRKRLRIMPSGCWEFQGGRITGGYGTIRKARADGSWGMIAAHRAMWEIQFGPIPDGLMVLHKCDNPPCCNPAHLFLGTQFENISDMFEKGRGYDRAGEGNPRAKLTWEKVRAIRKDDRAQGAIAAEHGVSRSLISSIKSGRYWKEKAA